jgi:hypothetical protein
MRYALFGNWFVPYTMPPRWATLTLLVLLAVSGCAPFRQELKPEELADRLHYVKDGPLEELVKIAVNRGQWVVDVEGQARQVLELNRSSLNSIHRRFFEILPRGAGLSEAFFLENIGSAEPVGFQRFPASTRKNMREFLKGVKERHRDQYQPLIVRQQKLTKQMIVYESGDGGSVIEFSNRVAFLEKTDLYGLFHLPERSFIFFGQKPKRLYRKDFLEADHTYNHFVQEFLSAFRAKSIL